MSKNRYLKTEFSQNCHNFPVQFILQNYDLGKKISQNLSCHLHSCVTHFSIFIPKITSKCKSRQELSKKWLKHKIAIILSDDIEGGGRRERRK